MTFASRLLRRLGRLGRGRSPTGISTSAGMSALCPTDLAVSDYIYTRWATALMYSVCVFGSQQLWSCLWASGFHEKGSSRNLLERSFHLGSQLTTIMSMLHLYQQDYRICQLYNTIFLATNTPQ